MRSAPPGGAGAAARRDDPCRHVSLINALTGRRHLLSALVGTVGRGERRDLPALVLYEYLRGPRTSAEIAHQEALWPADRVLPFGVIEATVAARLSRAAPRARQREFDIAIAAVVIAHDARLWTTNTPDFRDIPGLQLYDVPA